MHQHAHPWGSRVRVTARAASKAAWPPLLGKAAPALDMETLDSADCAPGRFDACCVPSVGVAVESELAFALAQAYRAKFGGDCMGDVHAALDAYAARLARAAR